MRDPWPNLAWPPGGYDPSLNVVTVPPEPLPEQRLMVAMMTFDDRTGLWNRVRPGQIDDLERRVRRLEIRLARSRPKKRRRS
jgi:hypothetical protein